MKTAYPQFQGTVQIRLYSNIPFDNTYKHHSLISDLFKYNNTNIYTGTEGLCGIPKERFLNRRTFNTTNYYYPRYDITGEFNFDYSNGLLANVVLELTPERTNANYMRVYSHNTNGGEYYYYFITGYQQINADTYRLSLELDVLMTYQDEFLTGMNDVPVFTARKHCHRYTDNGLMPCCADLKTGDDIFSGVKPSIISNIYSLKHNTTINTIKDIVWLYICADYEKTDKTLFPNFTCRGVQYPFTMLCVPLNCDLTLLDSGGTEFTSFTSSDIKKCLVENLINNGSIHGAKLSYYPPFTMADTGYISLSGGVLTLRALTSTISGTGNSRMEFSIGRAAQSSTASKFVALKKGTSPVGVDSLVGSMSYGAFIIDAIYDNVYTQIIDGTFNEMFYNSSAPTITDNRFLDPKLLFNPFRKYMLMAKYSADGVELYPELLFSEYTTNKTTSYFEFQTIFTPYISDMSLYTYLTSKYMATSDYVFNGYSINRIGLSGTLNYIMPVGENALEVFNSTQSNSFYQSKVASGVTGGLSMVGGVASIGIGAGLMSNTATATLGAGMITTGAMALAGGTSSIANTIVSANSKIEDLKNTPDSINIAGSTFISDNAFASSYNLPFITIYDVTSVVKENANDYFYNFGYQVARECYFNTELKYTDGNHKTDNNLFGRTNFNYVQTNDDITNKINANMPLVIKQKINAIFNNGITLWTFFGKDDLWDDIVTIININNVIDRWFMKCTLDNTEYKGE